ncbi:DUF4386 domain-containing protein [Actinomadura coerulea]|uniref:DUF4386 domain-containing protein n=1 Tax=Actinomadura coerulea TaxID=46159 RepID=UPI003439EB09
MPIILSPHRTDERIAGHSCLLRDYGPVLRIRPPEGGDKDRSTWFPTTIPATDEGRGKSWRVANIATAVVLFPIVKRQSESISLGYVSSRILESTVIVVGVVGVLAVVTLRQDLAGGGGADAALVGRSLVALKDQTFLIGPAFCAGFGNGLLLGHLMYRSGLVPRPMALIGLIGGPIACATATAVLFGVYEQQSPVNFLFTAPEIVWEASLGIWLVTKGFRPCPLITGTAPKSTQVPEAP